ncbi:MAG: RIO-type serine/threonine-protein kinase Rio1 [Candidatus Methanofastidiosum methylothiophilum]|uniref:non-specific serine/threonine protein kinase n=1 Tax=Candidatus Methanofastidiosum methylothiophilum TaxID=1705564 RepID=A0A150IS03_9EURY|nr:MAG: RIO-type serine/threonine-protein kinase Rio1 [Candidatus Methanofastidiosum methylthiophilus]KYC47809.1 MAG: RIO-type serine/threonine-protein kinase Rio1 [Candidatus Methanofastidiosum methylthiophilus]KYC49823.1 MAG: RIO-type serine/threonine-protein kinase Rio1 [Candidatus Methanofastidiosum methylthiophilus]
MGVIEDHIDVYERKEDIKNLKRERVNKDSEIFKVRDEVFDQSTRLTLFKLMNNGYIESLNGEIATGKEANVFYGKDENGKEIAVKIYRIATSNFNKMYSYLVGDPRFYYTKKDKRNTVFAWAKREFKNLKIASEVINVPKPIITRNNVLIMEFLGKNMKPYPTLKEKKSKEPEKEFNQIIEGIDKLYKAGLIHADLSEYNILIGKKIYFIDFAQGTIKNNIMAQDFLKRDIENISRYFSSYFEVPEVDETLKGILNE